MVLLLPMAACQGGGGTQEPGRLQDQGELICLGNEVTGQGNVWRRQDPDDLELRDLPCLTGDSRLHGTYVPSLTTSRDDVAAQEGKITESAEHRFVYDPGDPRLNEVEAYYVATHMANWLVGGLQPREEFSTAVGRARSNEFYLDYDKDEVESKQLCSQLLLGMRGVQRDLLNVDVFAHEFGHHLLFSLNHQIGNSLLHEGLADYLAAAFTNDSVVEPSLEWPGFDRDLANDFSAPKDVLTRGPYCQRMLDAIQAGNMASVYPGLVEQFNTCLSQDPATLQTPEPHWAGMILGGALWELRELLGEEVFHPVLFKALSVTPMDGTGDLLQQLLQADTVLQQGADQEAITEVFTRRGIAQNLTPGFPRIEYPDCP